MEGRSGASSLRYLSGTSSFEPLRPPSPESLGKPTGPKTYTRSRKWLRRLVLLSVVCGTIYAVDSRFYASSLTRTFRTFGTGALVAVDYKLNFRPQPVTGGTIQDVHRRSAERLFELLRTNGGLYLKMGQAIAMQSAVLPPEFQRMFSRMFDDAPQDEWSDVEAVIREDFGKGAEEVFGVSFTGEEGKGLMERRARASASVAQVHWARLADGREVAIKVQKREISKQISWDLWAFKAVTRIFSYWFDLPFYTMIPFITERLELETDFVNEAKNSETMKKLVAGEPALRERVYVPIVYPEFTTRRVLVTEWIEGVRLTLQAPDVDRARRELRQRPLYEQLKPERLEWKGKRGKGGLGVSSKEVMRTMVDLFSAQIFKWGVVHCDPHPGNIFIRRKPNGKAQLVLIDHGLYVYMNPGFRQQYSLFWKSLMTFDQKTIVDITEQWGIRASEVFASATLMRPYEGEETKKFIKQLEGKSASEKQFLVHQKMKASLKDFLTDEDKWPKELIFIGRNMRIVQGNNQYLGSPVNRIKLMGEWASSSLYTDPDLPLRRRLVNAWKHLLFKTVLAATDVAFYFFRLRQLLGWGGGMEDEVDRHMRDMAHGFGVEIQEDVFAG
ncbi:unnamed protein product [Parascedosporium putredinis]|uniref:ABC1 atypical kinase-like domain-containing protein n=1 Tax=Parascedosporium putredinis TaxID=1442378 RepID=A0A9P1GVK6_9PEZI|nr:unnamed protein product [Parascedosporium putredinis]CAI7987908.1 unnamed protein product [Parascedosporium putredinis]